MDGMSDFTDENPTPTVVKVSPRLISGVLNANNKDAIDWSPHGLLAYGSQNNIVVVECVGTALVQTLQGGHRHDITRIRWSRHLHYHDRVRPYTLRLAAADASGVVMVWNVATGDIKAELAQPGHKAVIDMHWMAFNDASYPLLLVLYDQSFLVLWDTEREVLVWKKDFTKEMNGRFTAFSVDPFTESAIAFVSCEYIWLLDDLSPARPPQNPLKKLEITIPPPPGTGSAAQTPTENPRKSRLLSGVQAMFQGGAGRGQQSGVREHEADERDSSECLSMMHSAAFRDHLFFVYQKHILIVDICIQQVVGTVHTERNHIGFFAVRECRRSARLLCLHETGVVTVRERKLSDVINESRQGSEVTYPSNGIRHDHDVQYELICSSEAYRMIHRNSKIVAFAISPIAECRAAVVLMDGRTLFYELRGKAIDSVTEKPRLVISSNFEALSTVPHCMKMCPPVTFKNWRTYRPLLACAVTTGNIQVINVATGQIERNICVHTTPVRGIEWTSLTSFLSFANATLQVTNQLNSNVKNELFLTEVMTGRIRALRTDRADEKPIELLAVSKHGQYFIVAFRDQPFELWDLKSLTLLSTVSQNFKSITCLEWSPKSALKRKHSEQGDEISKQIDPIFLKQPANDICDEKSSRCFVKEHFLAVDSQSKVCFFTVEGSVLKSNMRILVPVSSAITCTAWKADKLVLGDLDGNLSLWDITTKRSETTPSQRGTVKKVAFAPGRGNMKLIVLFVDAVELWEATPEHTMNRLASLKVNKGEISHVDWADSVSPLLGWVNGNISVMDMELKQSSTPIAELFFEDMPFLPSILNPSSALHLKSVLQHLSENARNSDVHEATKGFKLREDTVLARGMLADLDADVWEVLRTSQTAQKAHLIAHLYGDEEAIRFWTMFQSRIDQLQRLPMSFDLLLPQNEYRLQQLERALRHESKRGNNYQLTQLCVDEFLLLGDADRAVQLLLETEPPNELFTHDALRACLIACLKKENKSQSVVKLVATNLIASGDTQLGVQLLCVIHKALDACRYLQSNGQWDKSIWLAKCSLAAEEVSEVMKKWSDHLQLGGTNQRCRSALALLSIGEIVRCVGMLASNQMIERAVLLTEAAADARIELQWEQNKKEFRPPGLYLTYARYLHAVGNSELALSYCMKALDIPEAEDLKKEIEILLDDAVHKATS